MGSPAQPGDRTTGQLSESLTLGFLVLLDQLAPVERAVFVLADVFEVRRRRYSLGW